MSTPEDSQDNPGYTYKVHTKQTWLDRDWLKKLMNDSRVSYNIWYILI